MCNKENSCAGVLLEFAGAVEQTHMGRNESASCALGRLITAINLQYQSGKESITHFGERPPEPTCKPKHSPRSGLKKPRDVSTSCTGFALMLQFQRLNVDRRMHLFLNWPGN